MFSRQCPAGGMRTHELAKISVCRLPPELIQVCISMKYHSTINAAKKLGVTRVTIQRHITAGTITAPPLQNVGGVRVPLWTERDIKRVGRELRERKGRK